MLGVFIVIIGVVVAIFALGRQSVKDYNYKTRATIQRDTLSELYIPAHIAREIQEWLLNKETRMQMLETIQDELTEIHGRNWRERFEEYDNLYDVYFYYGGALRILYAKKGFIDLSDGSGYQLHARTFSYGTNFHMEHLNALLKTCHIIERELKKVRPDLQGLDLWFVPGGYYDSLSKKYIFSEDLSSGKLMFEFNKPVPNEFYNPKVRRLW